MDQRIIFAASMAQVSIKRAYSPENIIAVLQKGGFSIQEAQEALKTGNEFFRKELVKRNLFQVGTPGHEMPKLLCSDNSCPCSGKEELIPGKTGYLFIGAEVVKKRRDALTFIDMKNKSIPEKAGYSTPVLVCSTGAIKRGLNLDSAAEDAEIWYKEGLAPLRASVIEPAKTSNIVFIWLCPNSPNMNTMLSIVSKVCPEYSEIPDPVGKVALSWDNESMDSWLKKNDIKKIATESMNNSILDATKYVLEIKKVASKEFGEFSGEGIYLTVKPVMSEEQKTGNCFIATATYGSYDHPNVIVFREFRDSVLMKSNIGKFFITAYYFLSPKVAIIIHDNVILKRITLNLLNKIAQKIRDIKTPPSSIKR